MKLETKNLTLSLPVIDDAASLKSFEIRNRERLKKWESPFGDMAKISDEAIKERLAIWISECENKQSVRFVMKLKANPKKIIGFCNFTQMIRGAFLACFLGYKIDFEYEGKGLMLEALETAIPFIFEHLNLHRIMATYMPVNIRSAKLLNRLGFLVEGFAKNYLLINNKWEDHILTALSHEQWASLRSPQPKNDSLIFRRADISDLDAIVLLLADDLLGQHREKTEHPPRLSYVEAFMKISSDPNQELIVGQYNGILIGLMQITYLQHLTFEGQKVAHIESIRIHKNYQRQGFGKQMFEWAFERVKKEGCGRIQLMTDKRRKDSHKFYESLGFSATHEGMKLFL